MDFKVLSVMGVHAYPEFGKKVKMEVSELDGKERYFKIKLRKPGSFIAESVTFAFYRKYATPPLLVWDKDRFKTQVYLFNLRLNHPQTEWDVRIRDLSVFRDLSLVIFNPLFCDILPDKVNYVDCMDKRCHRFPTIDHNTLCQRCYSYLDVSHLDMIYSKKISPENLSQSKGSISDIEIISSLPSLEDFMPLLKHVWSIYTSSTEEKRKLIEDFYGEGFSLLKELST